MAAVRTILLNYNLKREICSATVHYHKHSAQREGRIMRKMLKSDIGKRKWYEQKQRAPGGPMGAPKLVSNHVSRRRTVLNKLFMQHITDLMATGEASTDLLGRRIEITHVNVTPDFRTVLVYFGSQSTSTQGETTQKILNDCAYRLRHELTQLNVMGMVPIIQFVENKQLATVAELDRRISSADYGEDYEPTIRQPVRKPEFQLNSKFSPEVKEKILQLENELEEEETEDDFYVDVPEMRHDVLGLNHHAIMARVKMSLNKSQEAARKRMLNLAPDSPTEANNISAAIQGFLTSKKDSEAFTEFLRKRQIEERKLRREKKTAALEYNMRTLDEPEEEESPFLKAEERDVDEFEDIKLESLK